MAQEKKTIEFRDLPDLLHVNADLKGNDIPDEVSKERFDKLSHAIADLIEASIREIHGLPQDNQQLLCGGCVTNVLQNALLEVMERGHIKRMTAAKILRSVSKDYFKAALEIGGAPEALSEIISQLGGLDGVNVEVIDLGEFSLDDDATVN